MRVNMIVDMTVDLHVTINANVNRQVNVNISVTRAKFGPCLGIFIFIFTESGMGLPCCENSDASIKEPRLAQLIASLLYVCFCGCRWCLKSLTPLGVPKSLPQFDCLCALT